MSTEAMREAFQKADWPLYKDTYNPPKYDTIDEPILGTIYMDNAVSKRFGTFVLGWQAATANQEALIQAALDAAAEVCGEYAQKWDKRAPYDGTVSTWINAAESRIRAITPQQVMERMK